MRSFDDVFRELNTEKVGVTNEFDRFSPLAMRFHVVSLDAKDSLCRQTMHLPTAGQRWLGLAS